MKLLVWDFDGTLGYRDQRWSGVFAGILQEEAPDFIFTHSDLSAALQIGFPWHAPNVSHTHINDANAWWTMMQPCFEKAFNKLGLDSVRSTKFAKEIRHQYCSLNQWHLYPDSLESLEKLTLFGWNHIVLSNHVPELSQILDHLGVSENLLEL